MMKNANTRNWLAASAAAFALALGGTTGARADVAYAFSQQQITNLSLTSATGTITPSGGAIQTGTNTGASFRTGVSATDPVDAPQSYLGPAPAPAENLFTHVATFTGNPNPVPAGTEPTGMSTGATLANFTRGDAAYDSTTVNNLFTTGVSVNNVAESYLNSGVLTGNAVGGWTLTASFTVSATTALNVGYGFNNSLYTVATGNASTAQANYAFNVTIRSASGTIYENTPDNVNQNFASPPNNSNMLNTSGTSTLTTGAVFLAGTLYTITISGGENTFVRLSVPEPGPIALAAVAGGLACLVGIKRKFARKTAA